VYGYGIEPCVSQISDAAVSRIVKHTQAFPPVGTTGSEVAALVQRFHPLNLLTSHPQHAALSTALSSAISRLTSSTSTGPSMYALHDVSKTTTAEVVVTFANTNSGETVRMAIPSGSSPPTTSLNALKSEFPSAILTPQHEETLSALAQDHCLGNDVCLVGRPGSGKTLLAKQFGALFGYRGVGIETVQLYKDMTARELCQTRSTDAQGNTVWSLSPVVTAALQGIVSLLPLIGCFHLPLSLWSPWHVLRVYRPAADIGWFASASE
jgi:hypothetical protein